MGSIDLMWLLSLMGFLELMGLLGLMGLVNLMDLLGFIGLTIYGTYNEASVSHGTYATHETHGNHESAEGIKRTRDTLEKEKLACRCLDSLLYCICAFHTSGLLCQRGSWSKSEALKFGEDLGGRHLQFYEMFLTFGIFERGRLWYSRN